MIKYVILSFLFVSQSLEENTDNRIVGGYNCSIGDHSYMVSIIHNPEDELHFIGGGTLLSERWVLTARMHLIFCHVSNFYRVVAGAETPSEFGSKSKHVKSSLVRRCYPSPKQKEIIMEIALLHLARPMYKGEKVSYVRMATYADLKNKTLNNICNPALIMGYGVEKYDAKAKSLQYPNLRCAKIPIISEADCKLKLPNFANVSEQLACLNGMNVSTCQGDAGGPVMCRDIQFGILSAVVKCGRIYPIPFIKLYHYQKFISTTIKNYTNDEKIRSKCNSNNILNLFILPFPFILHSVNINFNLV